MMKYILLILAVFILSVFNFQSSMAKDYSAHINDDGNPDIVKHIGEDDVFLTKIYYAHFVPTLAYSYDGKFYLFPFDLDMDNIAEFLVPKKSKKIKNPLKECRFDESNTSVETRKKFIAFYNKIKLTENNSVNDSSLMRFALHALFFFEKTKILGFNNEANKPKDISKRHKKFFDEKKKILRLFLEEKGQSEDCYQSIRSLI